MLPRWVLTVSAPMQSVSAISQIRPAGGQLGEDPTARGTGEAAPCGCEGEGRCGDRRTASAGGPGRDSGRRGRCAPACRATPTRSRSGGGRRWRRRSSSSTSCRWLIAPTRATTRRSSAPPTARRTTSSVPASARHAPTTNRVAPTSVRSAKPSVAVATSRTSVETGCRQQLRHALAHERPLVDHDRISHVDHEVTGGLTRLDANAPRTLVNTQSSVRHQRTSALVPS